MLPLLQHFWIKQHLSLRFSVYIEPCKNYTSYLPTWKFVILILQSYDGVRCSRQEVFYKKDVLTNFAKFLGCGLRPAFLEKEGLTQTFSYEFCKFLRTPFYRTVVASVEYYFRILFKVFCPQYVRTQVVRINLLFFRMECYNTWTKPRWIL